MKFSSKIGKFFGTILGKPRYNADLAITRFCLKILPPSSRVIARSDCSILNYHVTECLQVLRPPFRSLWRSYPACSPLCNYIGSYIGDCKLDKWRSGDLSLTQLTSGIVVSRAVAPKSHFTHVLQYTLHRQFTTATRTQLTVNLIGQ